MEITKQYRAEIAHRLPNHPGACQFIHGHSYLFEITVEGDHDESFGGTGMVMDFKDLKVGIEGAVGHWDHSLILSDEDPLRSYLLPMFHDGVPGLKIVLVPFIPTAENMAQYIAEYLCIKYGYSVAAVKVWETATSYAEWRKS